MRIGYFFNNLEHLMMNENKVYVGNLSFDISEDDLRAYFEQCGAITDIALIKDKMTQRLKGFGFITFEEAGAVQSAIELSGNELMGRPLRVSEAKERDPSSRGPRNFRGGRPQAGGFRRRDREEDSRGNR